MPDTGEPGGKPRQTKPLTLGGGDGGWAIAIVAILALSLVAWLARRAACGG